VIVIARLIRCPFPANRRGGLSNRTSSRLGSPRESGAGAVGISEATTAEAGIAGRRQIDDAITRFEAAFDNQVAHTGKLDSATDAILHSYVKAREALDAELVAVAAQANLRAAYHGEAFDQRKRELGEKFTAIKQQVAEQRSKYMAKLTEFEKEWNGTEAAEHAVGAFRKLFD